jgi:hypothetical protein
MKMRKISRQRKWQLENLAAGKCKLCPEMRAPDDASFCPTHREAYRAAHREYMSRKRRVAVIA